MKALKYLLIFISILISFVFIGFVYLKISDPTNFDLDAIEYSSIIIEIGEDGKGSLSKAFSVKEPDNKDGMSSWVLLMLFVTLIIVWMTVVMPRLKGNSFFKMIIKSGELDD